MTTTSQQLSDERITPLGFLSVDGAMNVVGCGMYPEIQPGDIVLYKTIPNKPAGLFFGKMYVATFIIDGEEYTTIKYIYNSEMPGFYKLVSCDKFPAFDIPFEHIKRLSLIKAVIRPM